MTHTSTPIGSGTKIYRCRNNVSETNTQTMFTPFIEINCEGLLTPFVNLCLPVCLIPGLKTVYLMEQLIGPTLQGIKQIWKRKIRTF